MVCCELMHLQLIIDALQITPANITVVCSYYIMMIVTNPRVKW